MIKSALDDQFYALQRKIRDGGVHKASCPKEWIDLIESLNPGAEMTLVALEKEEFYCGSNVLEDGWRFPSRLNLRGRFNLLNFRNAKFNELNCADAKFDDKVNFHRATFDKVSFLSSEFKEGVNFQGAQIRNESLFGGAKFSSGADFFGAKFVKSSIFSGSFFSGKVGFEQCEFESGALFECLKFDQNTELNFERAVIGGECFKVSDCGEGYPLAAIKLRHAIFKCPVVFDIHLKTCPDFSEVYFLNKFFIKETWLEEGERVDKKEKIEADDEPKFRFLKKYFAERGNHFKEQEYFTYEMRARRRRLISQLCFTRSKDFLNNPVHRAIEGLKNFFELALFSLYEITSNFGMSWVRPLACLVVSSRLIALRLDKIGPDSWVPSVIEFFNIFGKSDWLESSTVGFFEAFTKTLTPLSTAKDFADPYDWVVNIHCLINGALIFLLIIGLRNKFKIK